MRLQWRDTTRKVIDGNAEGGDRRGRLCDALGLRWGLAYETKARDLEIAARRGEGGRCAPLFRATRVWHDFVHQFAEVVALGCGCDEAAGTDGGGEEHEGDSLQGSHGRDKCNSSRGPRILVVAGGEIPAVGAGHVCAFALLATTGGFEVVTLGSKPSRRIRTTRGA